jgi:uracil-DNA glycosylase
MNDVKIEPSWKDKLQDEFGKEYFQNLAAFVKKEYRQYTIYPAGRQDLQCLRFVPVR